MELEIGRWGVYNRSDEFDEAEPIVERGEKKWLQSEREGLWICATGPCSAKSFYM